MNGHDLQGVIERVRRATAEITREPAADIGETNGWDNASRRSGRPFAIIACGMLVVGAFTSLVLAAKHGPSPHSRLNPIATVTPETTLGTTSATSPATTLVVTTDAATNSSTATAPSNVRVIYERVEVVLSGDLVCSNPIDTTGTFTSSVIETWIDKNEHRSRTTVTYPDGSTRDLLAFGSVVYPTSLLGRGEMHGRRLGCVASDGEDLVLSIEPAQSFVYWLNLDELLTPDERTRFNSFDTMATLLPDQTPDSRGRSSDVWQEVSTGTDTIDNITVQVEQTTNTYVSPETHRVTERTFTNSYESLGTATVTETLIDETELVVTADIFETAGYTSLDTPQPYDPPPCVSDPFPPPFMPDGSEVGPATSDAGSFGASTAIWGEGAPVQVLQQLGTTLVQSNFFAAVAAGDALSAGTWLAVVTPLDEVHGANVIELYNSANRCLRRYQVQPGVTLSTTTEYARAWIDALDTIDARDGT